MRIKAVTLGFVLAGTALGSGALTLGRARGAAWIGQPLDLIVPVQVDPGQTDAALCAEADVFHGDSRQDGNRVQVQVSPSDQPETFNLKIASSALIDEPVVTIYLRAGCTQKFSRKYVLLADFPSEVVAPLSRTTAQTATPLPVLVPAEAVQARQALSTTSPGNATPAEPPAASRKVVKPTLKGPTKDPAKTVVAPVAKQSASQKESPNKVEKPADSPVISSKPRLRLDPVETLSERVKSLESTTTGTTRSEEVARDIQRMELLQSDMKVLLEQAVKNEASLVAMRERLERAESDRVPVAAVYGLGALVLLCLGALALMWSKRPKNGAWGNSATKVTPSAKKLPSSAINEQSDGEEQDFEVNAEDIDKASFDALVADQAEAPKEKSVSKFIEKASVTKTVRSDYNADHQVDLRQQAEFLAKLGKVDEALQILKDGIRDNPKESPLLFLDLLGIANNFNRNSDFNMYREQMISLFNVKIPESALTNDEGRSLDDNPALLEHINSQWKSPHVLDVIEACIMRDPDAKESDPFDLAAFRELLNMHSVANEHHNAVKGA